MANKKILLLFSLVIAVAVIATLIYLPAEKLPVYWEVWKGSEFRGYIIPSLHVSGYSYKAHIEELLKKVDTVALEIDPREKYNYSEDGFDIELSLSEKAVDYFKNLFGNQTWQVLKTKKPGIIYSNVLNKLAVGHGMVYRMDLDAMELALENKRELIGLESFEDNVMVLTDEKYYAEWTQKLEAVAKADFWLVAGLDAIEILYRKGDANAFGELYKTLSHNQTVLENEQVLRDPVLQLRSKEVLSKNKTLIVVGAAHVTGMLDYLKGGFVLKVVRSK